MVRPQKSDAWMPLDGLALSKLHLRTIAIQLLVAGQERLLIGYGSYEHDQSLGYVLRIQFPADADSEIVLVEGTWTGEILPGAEASCDYLIRLG